MTPFPTPANGAMSPSSSPTRVARPQRKVSVAHFAFMRGLVQGLDARELWRRYMFGQGEYTPAAARRTIAWLRQEFAAAARREQRFGQARLVLIDVHALTAVPAPARPTLEAFAAARGLQNFSVADQLHAYQEAYPASADDARARRAATRRERLIAKQLTALQGLERLVAQPPLPGDALASWLNPDWVPALTGVGLITLRQLSDRINSIPQRWWRGIRAIGATKAHDIEAWLLRHEQTLRLPLRREVYARHPQHRPLVTHVDARGARHTGGVPGHLLVARKTDVVPLDRFILPGALDGSRGRFRAPRERCLIVANNDLEAILTWVKSRHGLTSEQRARRRARRAKETPDDASGAGRWDWLYALSHTQRGYLREAERFLLWTILQQQKALSDLTVEDCTAYRDFLADPRPEDQWCGPRNARRGTPAWRPFEGPLSSRAQQHSVVVLRSLFAYLNEVNYLEGNAWQGVHLPRAAGESLNVGRSLTQAQWDFVESCLNTLPDTSAHQRLRFALRFLYGTGLRLSEAVQAKVDDVRWVAYPPDAHDEEAVQGYLLTVIGKGDKRREVPLPQPVVAALRAYLAARGLHPDPAHGANRGAYLLGRATDLPARAPWTMAAQGALDPKAGVAETTLYAQLKVFFAECAARLEAHSDDHANAARLRAASTHWLRHTHASHWLARDTPVQVVQQNLGHAWLSTTTLYITTEHKRRMKAIQRGWGQGG